ncbi:unnamed protein product [Closterium sp. Naga37s-1]|nr:unnamed protein product [Closterium sp. Naga37s-1]
MFKNGSIRSSSRTRPRLLTNRLSSQTPRITSLPSSSLVDALCAALTTARSPQGRAQGRAPDRAQGAQGSRGERPVREGGGQAVDLLLEELERRMQTGVESGVEGLGLESVRSEEQRNRFGSVSSEKGVRSGRGGEERRTGGGGMEEATGGHKRSERRREGGGSEGRERSESREWGQLCARVLRAAAVAGNAEVGHRVMHAMLSAGVPVAVGAQISFLRALCNAGRMHEVSTQQAARTLEIEAKPWTGLRCGCSSRAAAEGWSPQGGEARDSRSAAHCVLLMEQCGVPCDAISYTELIKLAGLVGDREAHLHPTPSSPFPPSSPPPPPPLPLVALSARVVAFSRIPGALSDALQAMEDVEAAVLRELQGGHGRIGSGCGLLLERAGAVRLKPVRVGAGGKEGIAGVEEGYGLSTAAEGAGGTVGEVGAGGRAGAAAARGLEERSERSSARRGMGTSGARGTWGCNREGAWDGKQLLALVSQHEGHETEGVAAETRGESEGATLGGAGEGSGDEARGDSINRDMGLGLGMGRGMELQGAKEGREWEAVEMGLRVGWNAILNAAAKHARWDLALAMLQRMVQWGVHPDDYTINALTRAAFASHRPTLAQAIDALRLFHQIRQGGASNSSSRTDALADTDDGDDYHDEYDDDAGAVTPSNAAAAAAAASISSGEHATRLRFAGNALIRACSKEGRFDDAFQVFRAMLEDQVPVDTCTLQALLLLAAGPTTPTRWGIKGSGAGGGGGGDMAGDWMGVDGGWEVNGGGRGGSESRRLGEVGAGEAEGESSSGRWQSGDYDHEDMDGETGVSAVGWRDDGAGAAVGASFGAVMGEGGEEEGEEGGTRQREVWRRVAAVEAAMSAAGVRHSAASFCTLVRVLGGAGLCRAMQQHVQWGLSTPDAAGRPLTDTLTLNTAIAAAARLGQVHAARQLFALTEQHPHLTPTTVTFNALLNALAVAAAHRGAGSASAKGGRRGGDVLVERDGQWRGGGDREGEGGETDSQRVPSIPVRPTHTAPPTLPHISRPTAHPLTAHHVARSLGARQAACSAQDYKAAHRFLARMEQHPRLAPDQTSYSTAVAYAAFQGNIWHMELFLARLLRQRVPLSFSALASVAEAYAHAVPRRINQVTPATLALAEHSQQVQWEQGGSLEGGQGESKGIEKAEEGRRGRGSELVSGGEGEGGGVAVRSEEGRLMEFAWQLAAEVETSGEDEEEGGGAARRKSVVGWRARIEEQLQQWECSLK